MSLISFSKPSDADILQKIVEKDTIVSFVDEGSIFQNVTETIYIRTVKTEINKRKHFKKIIYVKKGIKWLFKAIEPFNNGPTEIKKLVS